jgi:hypothetical protein
VRAVCLFCGILVCSQSSNHPKEDVLENGDHSYEDLAKSGYKPEINLIYAFNPFFFSLLATENLTYHYFFEFLVFNFIFWQNFASEKIG